MKTTLEDVKHDNKVTNLDEYREKRKELRKCNICDEMFIAKTKYERFCRHCREHSERFHFSEWLNSSSF